jgi:glyoxylase-like metal-dependent hydrolase (beta-lactamase superfamily II)
MKTVRTHGAGIADARASETRTAEATSARSRATDTRSRVLGLNRSPVSALPRIHQLVLPTPWPVGPVQIYLVEGDPVTLIDTGVRDEASRTALESALDILGLGLEDIQRIVLTHFHADHLGQAETIRKRNPDVEVWAHELEAPYIEFFSRERDENFEGTSDLFREFGVPAELIERQRQRYTRNASDNEALPLCEPTRVDCLLRHGDRVPFKDFELRVIHTPGHTAGHIVLHEAESDLLITGDHIMGDAVPYTDNYYTQGPPDPADPLRRRPRFKGLPEYMRSIRELRRGAYEVILPAHGGIINRAERAIEDALLFYEVRIQRIERGLRTLAAMGQDVSAWEIWRALFQKADPVTEMRKRMLMVIGALDVLEESGRCETIRRDDGTLVHLRV